jgi:hypothetical protein
VITCQCKPPKRRPAAPAGSVAAARPCRRGQCAAGDCRPTHPEVQHRGIRVRRAGPPHPHPVRVPAAAAAAGAAAASALACMLNGREGALSSEQAGTQRTHARAHARTHALTRTRSTHAQHARSQRAHADEGVRRA